MDPTAFPFLIPSTRKPPIHRVALACIQCRARKVRCDATQPYCKRCLVDGKRCEYQKSRRGGRPRRPVTTTPPPPPSVEDTLSLTLFSEWNDVFGTDATISSSPGESLETKSAQSSSDPVADVVLVDGTRLPRIQVDELLGQYYAFFHNSHPCVLPRWALQLRRRSDAAVSDILLPVLLYIGSVFTHSVDSAPFANAASRALDAARARRPGLPSPFFVQALMLYSIAVYWSNEPKRGRLLLDEAIDGALQLGMNRDDFAAQNGSGDATLEESWRRTWWQMYVTDAHIAGSTHAFPTRTGRVDMTAGLPCEECQYESGSIPTPETLRLYNMREFSDADFSTFAQLIGFTHGINRVLATRQVNDIGNAKAICTNADTMMTAWCSLLPPQKRQLLRGDGSVDELLFKAFILMHTYVVDLHRELSSLKYSPIEAVSKCAPPAPPECNDSIKDDAHIHTAKVLLAVEKLNGLLTLPTRFTTHTPFIICMIANMTIAHLSACRHVFEEHQLGLERDKIRLNMGVLKMLGEFWPAGQREYHVMGIIAQEILSLKDEEIHVPKDTSTLPLDALGFNFDLDINWT